MRLSDQYLRQTPGYDYAHRQMSEVRVNRGENGAFSWTGRRKASWPAWAVMAAVGLALAAGAVVLA